MLHITKTSQSGSRLFSNIKMSSNIKKLLNNQIAYNVKSYHDKIPLSDIDNILRAEGYLLVQEDGTPWSGFLTGREGRANIEVAPVSSKGENDIYVPFDNTMLVLYWHKMDSGRYEIIAYLS